MAAYATGNDLIARYDSRMIGDLCQDDDEPVDVSSIPNHPNVLAALLDASGEIDTALMVGGQYTPAQLSGLTDNTRNHLIRITCAIAIALLLERRPIEAYQQLAAAYRKVAEGHLTALRRGENVFGVQVNLEAGIIDTATIDVVEVQNLNGVTARMRPYFPQAETFLPKN